MKRAFKFMVLGIAILFAANPLCYPGSLVMKNVNTANAASMSNSVTGVASDTVKLQSYNYNSMYIRNFNYDVKIDENVTPEIDSEWVLVPGLLRKIENNRQGPFHQRLGLRQAIRRFIQRSQVV